MRVTLLQSPGAGNGSPSPAELGALLRAAGHDVVHYSTKEEGFERGLVDPGDLLLVAGGDGTVAKVVRRLERRDVPLAILPLGTSNNIASACGLPDGITAEQLVAGLGAVERRRLDVGRARGPWGTERFLESAGVGCFAALLDASSRFTGQRVEGEDKIARGLRRFRHILAEASPRRLLVEADGEDCSGAYLLAIVLNIPRVATRIELAPGADPADGRLELVLVGEQDRAALDAFIDALQREAPEPFPIPSRRVERVRLGWDPETGHLDDERWPAPSATHRAYSSTASGMPTVELGIEPPALELLVPAEPSDMALLARRSG